MKQSLIALLVASTASVASAEDLKLTRFDTPQEIVDEHIAALNACDQERIMAQYPENAEIHLADGVILEGREQIASLFVSFCKSPDQGGLGGMEIIPERTTVFGNTVNVMWRAEAPYLSEPYKGSDAFTTLDGLMQAQVTTFDGRDMKMAE